MRQGESEDQRRIKTFKLYIPNKSLQKPGVLVEIGI